MSGRKGVSLIELLILVVMLFIFVGVLGFGFIGGICMGNEWYSESDVLRELKADHPKVERIVHTERNIWSYSVITVEEGGQRKTYLLDSNIFQNYRFHPAE